MCTNAISTFLSPDSSKQIFPAGMTSGEHTTATWKVAFPTIVLVALRVQAHAHARIFAWLLGTCISETTSDIAGNQTSMPEDQRELYTMQTTSAKVSRRQRHRGG